MDDTKKIEELLSNSRGCVNRFRDEYAFLSNFHKCKIRDYEGNEFTSAEAMFQSYKTTDPEIRAKFAKMGPKEAKAAGRKVKLRSDWEEIKFDVMWYVVYQKFSQNSLLTRQLIETSGMRLVEGNTWGDKYWGAIPTKIPVNDSETIMLTGDNRLGQILMQVRKILVDRALPIWDPPTYEDEDDGGTRYYKKSNMSVSPSITYIVDRRPFQDYLNIKMKAIKMMMDTRSLTIDFESLVNRKSKD